MIKDTIKKAWKLLDTALFGKADPKEVLQERYSDYCILKSSLLTEAFQMYKVVFPSDKWEDFFTNDIPSIIKKAKKITESIISSNTLKNVIKTNVLKEHSDKEDVDLDKSINEHVVKTTLSILIDSILLTEAIEKCPDWVDVTNTPEFDIIKGSYDMFKNDLIETILSSRQ